MNLYPILTPWAPPKSGQPFPPPPQRSDPNPTECFYPMGGNPRVFSSPSHPVVFPPVWCGRISVRRKII